MNEKKSRGRPRKYKNDAEKQKAFRERKKKEILKLEKEKEKLESIVTQDIENKLDEEVLWFDWTFQDLKEKSTKVLHDYKNKLEKSLRRTSINSPIKIIVSEILEKSDDFSSSFIRNEVLHSSREFDITLFNVTVLQLINEELSKRMSDIDFDYEIQIAEQRISELEAEIKEKKKQKISVEKQTK